MPLTIGIDIGGTKLAGGLVDSTGALIAKRALPNMTRNETTIVSGVAKLVDELRAVGPNAMRVGIGCAGLIDHRAGVVVASPNLPLRNIGLRDLIATRCGIDVVIDNDANAAAFAEATVGAGAGHQTVVCVTVGTGIGGGVVIDGQLLRGERGYAGEVGHVSLVAGGPVCACGRQGCFEAFASGSAIARMARGRWSEPAAEALRTKVGSQDLVTGELVGELALLGDPFCREVVDTSGRWLGLGFVSLANIFDPSVIVVGGGAGSGLAELLLPVARATLEEWILGAGHRPIPPVLRAALGADAGIVGAGLLAAAT